MSLPGNNSQASHETRFWGSEMLMWATTAGVTAITSDKAWSTASHKQMQKHHYARLSIVLSLSLGEQEFQSQQHAVYTPICLLPKCDSHSAASFPPHRQVHLSPRLITLATIVISLFKNTSGLQIFPETRVLKIFCYNPFLCRGSLSKINASIHTLCDVCYNAHST